MNESFQIMSPFHITAPVSCYWVCQHSMSTAVPRLFRQETTKQWIRHPADWSPRKLLSRFFQKSSTLTVKASETSRFFMYEENADGQSRVKDDIGLTQILQRSPSGLSELLCNEDSTKYHYWTSPVADVAPGLLELVQGYESFHDDQRLLDPRGPSLWMGSSGSATQAHYDVADNVLVQLFGTKRIRCYHPGAAWALHVFPDAHPRARKSQVNFDKPDHIRFPHFSSLPPPILDVVLRPGDALRIPAFWFHHVENGRMPASPIFHKAAVSTEVGPSVSLNIFALSVPMMAAQGIFRDASLPFGFLASAPGGREYGDKIVAERHYQFAVVALRALGWALLKGLGVLGSPDAFIRKHILNTRYGSLRRGNLGVSNNEVSVEQHPRMLTPLEEKDVALCIERVLPQFDSLQVEQDIDGISILVACHLLEIWAVELVGASAVADAWEAAITLET